MKNVAVVTGTRAEYGLLKPLLKAIEKSKNLKLKLLVTGMHLMHEFGNTYTQIEEDGFEIDAKIYDDLNGDKAFDIVDAMSDGLKGFASEFEKLSPDLVILLGDRSEMLMAATAAIIFNIPIAHIHGGETTEGAYDEFIRHAITKMSLFHFASCEPYRKRIIQMGEDPKRVFNVGAIGVDSILNLELLSRVNFENVIGRKLNKKSCIITFHPVTLESYTAEEQFKELLFSIDDLKDTTLIFTKPNSDKGGRVITEMIDDYVGRNDEKSIAFISMGQLNYLSSLQYVDFVIGNSSSGILEAPYFKIPTINIGDRQKGRIAPKSVIHCEANRESISKAIAMANSASFKKEIRNQQQIYGNGTASNKIIEVIEAQVQLDSQKKFFDLNPVCFEKF